VSVLEDRYRSLLRLLPCSYRQAWEEEMVATFLQTMAVDDPDEAECRADFGRPSLPEVLSVVSLAARLRLGGPDAPPRACVWGEAARLVALVGLLVNGVLGGAAVVRALWEVGRLPLVHRPPPEMLAAARLPDLWSLVVLVSGIVWVAAYLALITGRRRLAQELAGVALAPLVATAVGSTFQVALFQEPSRSLLTLWCVTLLNLCVVAALASFHGNAPPVGRRAWLAAGAVGIMVVAAVDTLTLVQMNQLGMLLDWPGLCCVAVLAGIAFVAARGATTAWTLALALLAAGTLAWRLASLADRALSGTALGSAILAADLVQAAAVLIAATWAARVSQRELRALPPHDTVPTYGSA